MNTERKKEEVEMNKCRLAVPAIYTLTLLQPAMDIASYFASGTFLEKAVTLLRLAVLLATAAVGFVFSDGKRRFFASAAVLLVFSALHFAFILAYTTPSPADAINLIRIYTLPITALSLYSILCSDPRALDALFYAVSSSLLIIAAVMAISSLTGTDPHTYPGKEVGVLGWFLNTNAQSAIVSMAFPFALAVASKVKRSRTAAALSVSLLGSAMLFFLATRLAYAAIFGVTLVFAFGAIFIRKRERLFPHPAIFLIAPILAFSLISVSPMSSNMRYVAENDEEKSELTDSITSVGTDEDLYRHYLGPLCDRFGFEAVYEAYGKTTDTKTLTSARIEKITYSRLLMNERPLCRIFGLDLPSMTSNGVNFDAENDFHGIFFLCGGVGLMLLIAFMLYSLIPFLYGSAKRIYSIDPYSVAVFCSLCCGLAHAFFTAGVLRRPNSSFYLAAALAAALYLAKSKETHKRT